MSQHAIRCKHLLIKHEGSRNPISRRTDESTSGVSKQAAIQELEQWRTRIVGSELSFEDAAKQRSDCGSYQQGGDLGYFAQGEMQKPFEKAAFELNIGDISPVVDTDSGVHIIKRIA